MTEKAYTCPTCKGTKECLPCRGMGEIFTGNIPGETAVCRFCHGNPKCKTCDGKGVIFREGECKNEVD